MYFLVKNHIPNVSTFQGLVTLQVENGDIKLKTHRDQCPGNATYQSYARVAELLASISNILENSLLCSLKASPYFSLLADESTDVASKEELSVCAHWLQDSKPVEHFLAIVQAKETNAEAITGYLMAFLQSKGIGFEKMHGIGFDGTSTVSCHRSGVQTCLRLHASSAVYEHCRCHKLQLAALNAAAEHTDVNCVLGALLTIWKACNCSPKKQKNWLRYGNLTLQKSRCRSQVTLVH